MSDLQILQIPVVDLTSTTNVARSAAVDSNDAIVLQVTSNPGRSKVGLVRWKMKRVSGTGANFTPLIFSDAAVVTAGAIEQEAAGAATAVGTLFDPTIDPPIWMFTDELGRLYLVPGPDAGSDNIFDYCLRFLVGR